MVEKVNNIFKGVARGRKIGIIKWALKG